MIACQLTSNVKVDAPDSLFAPADVSVVQQCRIITGAMTSQVREIRTSVTWVYHHGC